MSVIALDFLLGPDWPSRLIARGTEGEYSHVASLLEDGTYIDARSDLLGGVLPGVQVRDPAKEAWVKRRRCTFEVPQATYDAWAAGLRSHIGEPYGKRDIVDFITGFDDHSDGQWICSAVAVNELQLVGIIPPLPAPSYRITPNSLLLIVATAGFHIGDKETKPTA